MTLCVSILYSEELQFLKILDQCDKISVVLTQDFQSWFHKFRNCCMIIKRKWFNKSLKICYLQYINFTKQGGLGSYHISVDTVSSNIQFLELVHPILGALSIAVSLRLYIISSLESLWSWIWIHNLLILCFRIADRIIVIRLGSVCYKTGRSDQKEEKISVFCFLFPTVSRAGRVPLNDNVTSSVFFV